MLKVALLFDGRLTANLGYKSLWKPVKLFKKILVSKVLVSEGTSQINLCGVYRIRSLEQLLGFWLG
jgi:hypothetical protein